MLVKFTKYGSVGALGTLTNVIIFTVLTFMNVEHNIASTIAFLISVTQNYQLNKKWTFKDHRHKISKRFFKYLTLNFFSFLINLVVLNIVIYSFGESKLIQIIGQVSGIFVGMGFNFLGSYLIIFAKKKGN